VVVYDITKKDSYNGARSWVKELQKRGDSNVVIAIAGNKCDMESRRKVESEEAMKYVPPPVPLSVSVSPSFSLSLSLTLFTANLLLFLSRTLTNRPSLWYRYYHY